MDDNSFEIKKIPEDFIVIEVPKKSIILLEKNKDEKNAEIKKNNYLILKITKKNLNTEEVAQILSKELNIKRKEIGYAGAKDKKAITTQYFSIKKNHFIQEKTYYTKHGFFKIENIGFDKRINLGELEGNKFIITIRKLKKKLNQQEKKIIFKNLFGEQRFSEKNDKVGYLLIKKEFKKAAEELGLKTEKPIEELKRLPKKNLLIYLHAFQSRLWNEIVKKNKELPEKLPLIGFGIEDKEIIKYYDSLLKDYNLTKRDFIIKSLPGLSLEGDYRDTFIRTIVKIEKAEEDELNKGFFKQKIKFFLPKGSYATVLLRGLLKK